MSLIQIVREVQSAKGTNAKVAILEANKTNEELKSFLHLVYEPTINFYMTDLPKEAIPGMLAESITDPVAKFNDLANKLNKREVTGFAAKQHVTSIASMMDRDAHDLLKLMIQRDIKAGVAATTINKVWPGLITQVPYMRCVLPKDSKIKTWAWGTPGFYAFSQIKADGMYANIEINPFDYSDAGFKVTSRNGSVFPFGAYFSNLKSNAIAIATRFPYASQGVQLQGEMLVKYNGEIMAREKGNGILNSILQTGEDPGADYVVVFHVWDAIPLNEATFKNKYNVPYKVRYSELSKACSVDASGAYWSGSIELIETRMVNTYEEASKHFLEAITRGEEGTIIKHPEAIWLDGDNKEQVKGKLEFECDLQIIDFLPGDTNGKYASTFGSLLCASGDMLLMVGVSGMPDATRNELHEKREFYRGKIVTVRSNDIMYSTDNGKTPHSLFLPRLIEIRLDKTTADSFQRIVDQYEAAKKGVSL